MAEVDQMTAPETETAKKKETKPEKKKSGLKFSLILILVSQLLFAGAGFFVVNKFIKPDPAFDKIMNAQPDEAESQEGAAADDAEKQIFLLEDIIVNPAGTRGSRYLSVSIGVETKAEHQEAGGSHGAGTPTSQLDQKKPLLRDALIRILSSKTIIQLTSTEEKEAIRQEILQNFQELLAPTPVYQIYFVDFVLQ
jgi:flagellar FliL protein